MKDDTTQILVADSAKAVDPLNTLLRGELSAVETYGQAIEKFGSDAPPELIECQRSHQARALRLQRRIRELGGRPSLDSGTWGAFAKLVEGGAALFGRKAALNALEEGEDHGLAEYRERMDDMDVDSRRLVESELMPEQQATHDAMSRLCRDCT